MSIISYKTHGAEKKPNNAASRTEYSDRHNQPAEIIYCIGTMMNINSQHELTDGHNWHVMTRQSFWPRGERVIASYPLREHGQLCFFGLLAMVGCGIVGIQTFSFASLVSYWHYITAVHSTLSETQSQNSGFGSEKSCTVFLYSSGLFAWMCFKRYYCAVQVYLFTVHSWLAVVLLSLYKIIKCFTGM